MTDDPRINVGHLRAMGYCAKGSEAYAARFGLDWKQFVKHGMLASELDHINDEPMKRLLRAVRGMKNGR